ncbi:hypothetical protein TNCV_15121 [Trichonephila clavipes]|nr:hypothetical protein TNCV_15121 [Trichonephila clavipes]
MMKRRAINQWYLKRIPRCLLWFERSAISGSPERANWKIRSSPPSMQSGMKRKRKASERTNWKKRIETPSLESNPNIKRMSRGG